QSSLLTSHHQRTGAAGRFRGRRMTTSTPPAGRYGRRTRRTPVIAAAALLVLAALAWSAWGAISGARQPVRWADGGCQVHGDAEVSVSCDVTVRHGSGAVCTVQALNAQHAEVGRRDVRVAGPGTVRVTSVLPTSERAVTGVVKACAALGR